MSKNIMTETINISVAMSGNMQVYIARPSKLGRFPMIIIGMEIFGVNQDMKDAAKYIAKHDYVAAIPDFYHRTSPGIELSYTAEDRTKGLELLHKLKKNEVIDDVKSTINYFKDKSIPGSFGFLGFSSGGHIGYLAATIKDISATAIFYPGWLTNTDIPLSNSEPPINFTKDIKGKLLIIAGEDDHLVTPLIVSQIKNALTNCKVPNQFITYPKTKHGFLIAARKETYNPVAAKDAWNKTIKFFKKELIINN